MRIKLTDRQLTDIIKNMVILIDTQEKKINHITDWFDKNKIKYERRKLDFADYSCYIIIDGVKYYFDRDIVIERKKDIDEICGNLKGEAPRIKKEFSHINKYDIRCHFIVEDYIYDKHLRDGKYRSQYDPKTLYARLKALEAEYNFFIRPIKPDYAGSEIYNTLKYYVMYKLKKEGFLYENSERDNS